MCYNYNSLPFDVMTMTIMVIIIIIILYNLHCFARAGSSEKYLYTYAVRNNRCHTLNNSPQSRARVYAYTVPKQ